MRLSTRLLLGRLLTRSGDQAWDFATPIILLKIVPGEIRVAAVYYFIARLAVVLLLPTLAGFIDRVNRYKAAVCGIILQLMGVILGVASIYLLSEITVSEGLWSTNWTMVFSAACVGGILSSLGSSFMDIAIANDLVPSAIPANELSKFNGKIRRVDLVTEVGSPILAGLLLVIECGGDPLSGVLIVALWNVVSFAPEFLLLRSIFNEREDLRVKTVNAPPPTSKSVFKKLSEGWHSFFKEPVALAAIAYALLWLSVLSPHGVLLTGFLKDAWKLPEWEIGVFRGLGALVGIAATFAFPILERKFGLIPSTRNFIVFQAVAVTTGLIAFMNEGRMGQVAFLALILLSRFGLYGFSLGETQIRQLGISPENRGRVNGFASALTAIATLGLYGAGALLSSTQEFRYLIFGSVFFVLIATIVFALWSRSRTFDGNLYRRS